MEEYQWLFTLPAQIAVGLLGMMVHFLKKNIKGETLTDIGHYFHDNFKSTFIAAITTVMSVATLYFTLSTGQAIDLVAVFSLGYNFDSALNKWQK